MLAISARKVCIGGDSPTSPKLSRALCKPLAAFQKFAPQNFRSARLFHIIARPQRPRPLRMAARFLPRHHHNRAIGRGRLQQANHRKTLVRTVGRGRQTQIHQGAVGRRLHLPQGAFDFGQMMGGDNRVFALKPAANEVLNQRVVVHQQQRRLAHRLSRRDTPRRPPLALCKF